MFPPQQQTPPPPPPSTGQQVGQGYAMLKKLADDAAKRNAQAQAQGTAPPPAQPPPPPIRTDSIGGLLQSLHDRLSYAIFGPADPKTTASNGAGGGL